jgi:hypothetical protein
MKQHGKFVCHSKTASSMEQALAHDLMIFHETFDSKKHFSVRFVIQFLYVILSTSEVMLVN